MPAIPYIKRKIGQSYLVWLQNSNSYIQFEEPAWFVFRRITKRYKVDTIVEEFANRYGVSPEESLVFVSDIRSGIEKMNQKGNPAELHEKSEAINDHTFEPYSIHQYRLGNKLIAFSFENKHLEHYLHPLICPFETTDCSSEMPLFELFAHHGKIIFRFNGEVKGVWSNDETHLVKGLIFMVLINVMYDKTDADWLMTVHASAISNGTKTVLFAAPPNNGKTTIAALLQANGYQLISDDFVPIDRISLNAYPFPIAMSVKEGSMDLLASLFPTLAQKPLNYINPEKSVRYLPSNNGSDLTDEIFPVAAFVFIEYNFSVDYEWEKLNAGTALKLLLDQAWVTPLQGNAEILFDKVLQLSFYKLTYSNNQKALDVITNLFEHDK